MSQQHFYKLCSRFFTLALLFTGCKAGPSAHKPQNILIHHNNAPGALHSCLQHGAASSSRPKFEFSIESEAFPLTVHFNASSSEEYAQRIINYAETSWETIVHRMGFRAPLGDRGEEGNDRVDIYIRGDLAPGVGGYTGFSGFEDSTENADAYGYLVIAENLNEIYIKGVVAHEFFHLVQMAYDWFEHPGFMEATAVWITDHVFDEENFYSRYYAYYNMHPDQSLDFISLADPFQYGAGMWFQYLDERFGRSDGSLIKSIWENTVQSGFENEPDYYDAMRHVLGGQTQFDLAFKEFAEWRYFVASASDGKHLQESETWAEKVRPVVEPLGSLAGRQSLEWTLSKGLQPYSHAFLLVEGVSDESDLDVVLSPLENKNQGVISVQILAIGNEQRMVMLTRTMDRDYDPETSPEDRIVVSGIVKLRSKL